MQIHTKNRIQASRCVKTSLSICQAPSQASLQVFALSISSSIADQFEIYKLQQIYLVLHIFCRFGASLSLSLYIYISLPRHIHMYIYIYIYCRSMKNTISSSHFCSIGLQIVMDAVFLQVDSSPSSFFADFCYFEDIDWLIHSLSRYFPILQVVLSF